MDTTELDTQTKRWFTLGFKKLWVEFGYDLKYKGKRKVFAALVAEATGVDIYPPVLTHLFKGEGGSYPGDKMRQALASHFGMTADEVIAIGRKIEQGDDAPITADLRKEPAAVPDVPLHVHMESMLKMQDKLSRAQSKIEELEKELKKCQEQTSSPSNREVNGSR
jgi:hypothetical protein